MGDRETHRLTIVLLKWLLLLKIYIHTDVLHRAIFNVQQSITLSTLGKIVNPRLYFLAISY